MKRHQCEFHEKGVRCGEDHFALFDMSMSPRRQVLRYFCRKHAEYLHRLGFLGAPEPYPERWKAPADRFRRRANARPE